MNEKKNQFCTAHVYFTFHFLPYQLLLPSTKTPTTPQLQGIAFSFAI